MNLSFSNICVRKNNDRQSILSFGEMYSYCILYYLVLKRFLTIHNDSLISINTMLNYINNFYININNNIKRQRIYFKSFLALITNIGIFKIANDILIDDIKSDDIISLKYNIEKEKEIGFTIIDEDEFDPILKYSKKAIDNIKLLNMYCDISSRIYIPKNDDKRVQQEQYKFCYPTFDTFKNDGILSKKDVIKEYLDILVKLNLIRYKGVGELFKDGEVRTGSYHYILVKDYPSYTEKKYDDLLDIILKDYKKAKNNLGWTILGKKKTKKVIVEDKPVKIIEPEEKYIDDSMDINNFI